MKFAFLIVTALILTAFTTVPLTRSELLGTTLYPPTGDDWRMFRHDASHTGFSTSKAPGTNNLLWKHSLGGGISSSPIVSGGKLFVGRDTSTLYCLDTAVGAEQWDFPTSDGIYGTPAGGYGKIYFGCMNGKVYALNPSNGKEVWNFTAGSPIRTSPALADGKVFIGADNGKLYALNATTGALQWGFQTEDMLFASPAVANGKVYVGALSGKFYAIGSTDGKEKWNFSAKSQIRNSPATSGNRVFLGNEIGTLYCLNASSGAVFWSNGTNGAIGSSPAIAYGKVFVGSDSNYTYAFNENDGTLVWKKPAGGFIESSPAVADGKVFSGSMDGIIYAYNSSSGNQLWNYTMGVPSSPAIADGKVFISSQDSNVYCFGPGLPTLLVGIAAPATMPASSTAKLTMTVKSSATLLPVENALVNLKSDRGGSFDPADNGYTDKNGELTINFIAPVTQGMLRITANASRSNYNSGSVFTDISILPLPSLMLNITANPQVIESGGTSDITVHVSNASSGSAISNAHVALTASDGNFTLADGYTQPTGDFNTVYQGIWTSSAMDIEINTTVSKTGFQDASKTVYLTLRPKLNVTITANTTVVIEKTTALITVQVTDRSPNPSPIKDANVSLFPSQGAMSPSTGKTDNAGVMTAIFTAPDTGGLQQIICQIAANASKPGFVGDNRTIDISVVNKTTPFLLVSIDADPKSVPSSGSSSVAVIIRSSTTSEYVNNATVTLSSDSNGTFTPVVVGGGGRYTSTFNAPAMTKNTTVKITATAVAKGFAGQGGGNVQITVTTDIFEKMTVTVEASPTSIKTTERSEITVRIESNDGNKIAGAALTFGSIPNDGTFDTYTENASKPGEYRTYFYPPITLLKETNYTVKVTAAKPNYLESNGTSNPIKVSSIPNRPPTCTIDDPIDGTEISGQYLISGNASDPENSLVVVQIQIVRISESLQDTGWLNVTGTMAWYYNWDTSLLKNGVYKICVRAFDGSEYSSVVKVNATVNNEGPGNDGIPGFDTEVTLLAVIVAFVAVSIFFARKKKHSPA